MKYVFVLPFVLSLGCGFATSPFDSGDDPSGKVADIIAHLGDAGEIDAMVEEIDAARGVVSADGHIEGDDADAYLEPDGGAVAADTGVDLDGGTTPLSDAAVVSDATVPTDAEVPADSSVEDAASPDADAGGFTDQRLCSVCTTSDVTCGPQSFCYVKSGTQGVCLPIRPPGRHCNAACFSGQIALQGSMFGVFVCVVDDTTDCQTAVQTDACFN